LGQHLNEVRIDLLLLFIYYLFIYNILKQRDTLLPLFFSYVVDYVTTNDKVKRNLAGLEFSRTYRLLFFVDEVISLDEDIPRCHRDTRNLYYILGRKMF
jgi:hypothetical protein